MSHDGPVPLFSLGAFSGFGIDVTRLVWNNRECELMHNLKTLQTLIKKTLWECQGAADFGDFAGFGNVGGWNRSLGTLWYLLIWNNIWIQCKDALQVDLRQERKRQFHLTISIHPFAASCAGEVEPSPADIGSELSINHIETQPLTCTPTPHLQLT